MSGVRVVILGPVRAEVDGVPVAVPGARVRLLLARLALARGRIVPADVLIDDLWAATALADATNTLQALVSRLRKVVGAAAVELTGGGYRLAADVDAARFEELAAQGRREVAEEQYAAAVVSLDAAMALWAGTALGDLPDAVFVREAAARLAELRLAAVEDRAEAALRLGRHDEVLTATAEAHPLRERLAALRIRALYESGHQAAALAGYEKVRGALAEELGVDPGPELRQAHLAIVRGEPVTRPTLIPGRLPAQLTGFTGRDGELALLARQLADARLVTVVGPGGVGKTRLAVEAAARHPVHDRGRVWFVPLAGATTDVAGAVLGVLSASRVRPERRAVPDQLVELIGPEPAVLVLDNCEHLVAAAAEFTDGLVQRLPLLTVLATSLEPLAITGEALCRLAPLGRHDAVRLFVARARAVRPEFTPDDLVDLVDDVCRRLDGLPLALELAAARLRSMSLEQVAQRLDDRFRLLTAGSRTALPRHRTLHAVVEWSWDLLTDQERLLAARLSLFPGRTTAPAVAAVCGDGCEDVLAALVEKSFVQWDGQRYRMLETIRAFAAERLDEAPTRFVRYFVEQAEVQEARARSRDQLAAIRWFDEEYDNLLAAVRMAIDDRDADAAARLVSALLWYWHTLRFDARADGLVAAVLGLPLPRHRRAALTAARQMTDGSDPTRVRAVIEDCVDSGALTHYPILLLWTAPMAYFVGHRELAERLVTMAHADPWAAAIAAWARGVFRNDRGDWAGAAAQRRRALRGFEAVGERLGLSFTLARVAQDHALSGAHDEAIAALTRCVTLAAEVGWPEEISYRARLGAERLRAGDVDGAREDLAAALRQAVERGQPQLRMEPLVGLADLHRRTGDPARAEELLDDLAALVAGLPAAELTAAILSAPVRTACRLGAPNARELLPVIAQVGTAARDLTAPAAELLARVLAAEGDAAGAATALGMSEVVRGTFDRGNPELRELVADLTARLGPRSYATAYDQGATMPRDEALARLHAL